MISFAFHIFGEHMSVGPTEVRCASFASLALAKAAAKRIAQETDSPVDLAYDDGRPWDASYVGTAQPLGALSATHFGRLD